MIYETIVATKNTYTITIPKEWIGKRVTVIYDTEWLEPKKEVLPIETQIKASDIFQDCQVDLSNYKFNRESANEYE